MAESTKSPEGSSGFDPNVDHYPTLKKVLRKIDQQDELHEGPVDRVEVSMMANGEANVRVWKAKAEEPDVLHWSSV